MLDVSGTGLGAAEFCTRLKDRGVLINPINSSQLRLVTHSDVDRQGCNLALEAIRAVASEDSAQ